MKNINDSKFFEVSEWLSTLTPEKVEKYINSVKSIPDINPETAEAKRRLLAIAEKHKKIMPNGANVRH
ncbi:MAG: hypothetical protein K2J08_06010 [Ruminococcus sp.]|nr:hypothetical protein [Ruminococcus sp.]